MFINRCWDGHFATAKAIYVCFLFRANNTKYIKSSSVELNVALGRCKGSIYFENPIRYTNIRVLSQRVSL